MDYKKKFPIFIEHDVHYLDTAATSQKPQEVIDSIVEYYENYNGNPGRGSHALSIESSGIVNSSRITVKDFINAKEKEEVIFTKNTTEAINLLAYSYGLEFINEGDEIILGISNHHANIVPWQFVASKKKAKLKYVHLDKNGQFDLDDFQYKLTEKTKIVAVSAVVNVTGVIQPIKEIIELAHLKGALVLIDAAQSVLHFGHNVQELDADFLVFSGHKIFAPMGVGVLYGKRKLLEGIPPFLYGGDMIEFVTEQESTYAPIPNKFEGGTPNVEAIYGLQKAIEFINKIGYDTINKIERELDLQALFEIGKLGFVELYHADNVDRVGVIAFNVKGVHSHDVAFILDSYGVAVRSGHHCAQPLMNYLNVPSCCRASFSIYNTHEDIYKLIEALKKVKEVFGI
ncbi:MAG: SufS family cysteine desulfurase [Leptotrichiaceae bacterium]|jgi:cysteine desulfurase/selenocysteine lyase|nr:SufS family cysteine desulfurase [Leptotrichiaceae bacterium]MBP7026623.1 SufS family cysteine desulfurase [Leptotrichiaceae bacterium]MBP8637052.1 SufS family cysteine desulfurase [Leptotrichiaceae bacterium]MBP9538735.1 SufS family cysteine desulfurase [Leptotrichiaceae bacterium]MBP9876024.1 SufS family cysteine desulfurase [Leptotrichiaceae bacterium]